MTLEAMKTKIIFYLLSFIFIQALPAQAVKKIEANPINIAYMLAQDTDSASMAKTCEYYGYVRQSTQDGYTVFKHTNGSIIRYTFKNEDKDKPYPYVEVKSKSSSREIDAILSNLGFQKQGNNYELKTGKFTRSKITYRHGSNGFLVFHKIRSPQSSTAHSR